MGVTGDLSTRKLLPAIEAIYKAGALPEHFTILGTTRAQNLSWEALLKNIDTHDFFKKNLELIHMDTDQAKAYRELATRVKQKEEDLGGEAQILFYMSVPPQSVPDMVELLGASGLSKRPRTKLLLEKPFGTDLVSAQNLVAHIEKHFTPEQVYRIDHYLAKHMVRNLMVFREFNALFRRTWSKDFIDHIDIIASETIGIEGRARFYEGTGALRDVAQSHLLQLAALTLTDPVSPEAFEEMPRRRAAALRQLSIRKDAEDRLEAVRGQYQGYRTEVERAESTVETFVSMTLESKSPKWIGVPIRLMTGKKLKEKSTEVRIYYKRDQDMEANELILRLQPNEGVSLALWSKRPGYKDEIEQKLLRFQYADEYAALPDAYEQVLVDVIRSDHDLFVSSEEILESWRIIAPLQESWTKSSNDLVSYEPGADPFSISRLDNVRS
jgi:glucose-6-phosphate 1-dehydrogenase